MANTNYEIDINITCRHQQCSTALREIIINDIQSLTKYHNHIIDCQVILDKEGNDTKVDIILHVPGHSITGIGFGDDQDKAFDSAFSKTKKQLKKLKSKITDHQHTPLSEIRPPQEESDDADDTEVA